MANFCKFCGTKLEEEQLCTCEEAVTERENIANSSSTLEEETAENTTPASEDATEEDATTEKTALQEETDVLSTDSETKEVSEPVAPPQPTEPTLPNAGYVPPTQPLGNQPPQAPHQQQGYYQQPNQPPYPNNVPPNYYQQPGQVPPQYGQPAPPQPGFQMPPQVTKAAGQVGGSFKRFVKNPIQTMDHQEDASFVNGLLLVTINAIAFVLYLILTGVRSGFGFAGFMAGIVYPFITIFVGGLLLFAVIFVGIKIFNGNLPAKALVNIIGISSIPWIAVLLVCTVISVIFGIGNSIFNVIQILLFLFAGTFTTLLLERGLRKAIPHDGKRMVVLAIAIAIQFTFASLFFMKGLVSSAISYSSSLFNNFYGW